MKVALKLLGCKVNQAECEEWRQALACRHFEFATQVEKADLVVVNTCIVTKKAEIESRRLVRSILTKNKGCKVVLTGCLAGLETLALDRVVIVRSKAKVIDVVEELLGKQTEVCLRPALGNRTRELVKIEDGCDNACSFCVVWRVRGAVSSVASEDVIRRVQELDGFGVNEVVLVGVNIGKYRCGSLGLVGLLRELLAATNTVRIRLSSLNPQDLSEDLIDIFKNQRICAHLHLSLQSGSNKVLRLMNRRYTREQFIGGVKKLKKVRPNIAITGDLIVGFPAETEEDFELSMDVLKTCGFAAVHVFPYSVRPENKIAGLSVVPATTIRARALRARKTASLLQTKYEDDFIGSKVELVLEKPKGGVQFGTASNQLKVLLDKEYLRGSLAEAVIVGRYGGQLFGKVVKTL